MYVMTMEAGLFLCPTLLCSSLEVSPSSTWSFALVNTTGKIYFYLGKCHLLPGQINSFIIPLSHVSAKQSNLLEAWNQRFYIILNLCFADVDAFHCGKGFVLCSRKYDHFINQNLRIYLLFYYYRDIFLLI